MCFKPTWRAQSGVSLIELVMFIVIVGIAVVGVLHMFDLGARASPDPMRRKQALAIAEGMMEEVRLARFTLCDGSDPKAELPGTASPADCNTPENVGLEGVGPYTRPYDNVNDYVDQFGTGTGKERVYTTDAAGNGFPNGYSAVVSIVYDGAFGPAGAQIDADATPAKMNVLRITVTVTYAGGDPVVLDGYRTRYAPRSL